jgi:hypothetical protein
VTGVKRRTWRDGWTPLGVGDDGGRMLQPERVQREYRSRMAYLQDAVAMAQDRWQVDSVVDHIPRGALATAVVRSWCRLTGRPTPAVVVTYKRLH